MLVVKTIVQTVQTSYTLQIPQEMVISESSTPHAQDGCIGRDCGRCHGANRSGRSQAPSIIPVMSRCEVATSHYQISYYFDIFWFILLAIKKEHEELEAGNDEVFVSIFLGYVFEFPGLDDQLLCLKMGEGSDHQNVCSLENGTMTWWATGCWQGETHPPASYSILQCDDVIRVVFTLRTCLNKDWRCSMCSMWPSEHRAFVPVAIVAFPKACRRRRRGSKWASPWGICWRTGETSWSMWWYVVPPPS